MKSLYLSIYIQDGKASPPPVLTVPRESPQIGTQVLLSPARSLKLAKAPTLEKKFKKPPPDKKRRRPSKDHLKQLAAFSEDGMPESACSLYGFVTIIELAHAWV